HQYRYRGFDDPAVTIEPSTRWYAGQLAGAFLTLAEAQRATGDLQAATETMRFFIDHIPPERFEFPDSVHRAIQRYLQTEGLPQQQQ
ncbi:MAG TPA: hypothetical protein VKA68_03985, partial [bacterium]|nr:hypothetical protein [bacterium]